MEPGPDSIRRSLAWAVVAGVWVAAWTAVFTMQLSPGSWTLETIAIVAAIVGGWTIRLTWWRLTAGCLLIGAGIGMGLSVHWAAFPIAIIAAAVLVMLWWQRLAPRLSLYRSGLRAQGQVAVAEGSIGSEDTHVTRTYVVQLVDAQGAARALNGSGTFPVGDRPKAGDPAEVYYSPAAQEQGVAVFGQPFSPHAAGW